MPDQTLSPEQNERAERWKKNKPAVVTVLILLCLYSIFDGMPNPPLAVFYGIASVYVFRT